MSVHHKVPTTDTGCYSDLGACEAHPGCTLAANAPRYKEPRGRTLNFTLHDTWYQLADGTSSERAPEKAHRPTKSIGKVSGLP